MSNSIQDTTHVVTTAAAAHAPTTSPHDVPPIGSNTNASASSSSLTQKRTELSNVERQLDKAKQNLERLKRYWSQLDYDERTQLYDRLEQRDVAAATAAAPTAGATQPSALAAGTVQTRQITRRVKKKVIVGNTSTFVPQEQREKTDQYTHKWMIYVRGPKEEPDLSWLKKIRVHLHASFAPNDIVDLYNAPYHLSRRGYGEFPVKLQLFLTDANAPPITITHQLTLDKEHSGKQVISQETIVDIEMDESAVVPVVAGGEQQPLAPSADRDGDTVMEDASSSSDQPPSKRQKLANGGSASVASAAAGGLAAVGGVVPSLARAPTAAGPTPGQGSVSSQAKMQGSDIIIPSHPCMKYENSLRREMTEDEKIMFEAASKYPLIVKSGTAPYMSAKSNEQFMSWTIGRRKACERLRANYVQDYIKHHYSREFKVGDIAKFCRLAGLSPVVVHNDESLEAIEVLMDPRKKHHELSIKYCKYCGCSHINSDTTAASGDNAAAAAQHAAKLEEQCRIQLGISKIESWPMTLDETVSELARQNPTAQQQQRLNKLSVLAAQPPPPLVRGYAKEVESCHEICKNECTAIRKMMAQIGIVDAFSPGGGVWPQSTPAAQPQRPLSMTELTQGKMTDLVMLRALECFAKSLIDASVKAMSDEKRVQIQASQAAAQRAAKRKDGAAASTPAAAFPQVSDETPKILTPHHVLQAIKAHPQQFEFLTPQVKATAIPGHSPAAGSSAGTAAATKRPAAKSLARSK